MNVFLYASVIKLTSDQMETIRVANNIGNNIVTSDKKKLGKVLASIVLNESNAGNFLIDKYEDYYYILNNSHKVQIQPTSSKRILYNNEYKKVFIIKNRKQPLRNCSFGDYQIKISTAEIMINTKPELEQFKGLLKDKILLVHQLQTNQFLSAEIAGSYLKDRYELAKKLHYRDPLKAAISSYNGGWVNTKYYNKYLNSRKIALSVIK